MIEAVGWAATLVFAASYFSTRADTLKRVQMLGALLWAFYGLFIGAAPVVAANLLVFGAAGWTLTRQAEGSSPAGPGQPDPVSRQTGSPAR